MVNSTIQNNDNDIDNYNNLFDHNIQIYRNHLQ